MKDYAENCYLKVYESDWMLFEEILMYIYIEYDTSWSIKLQWFGRDIIMKSYVYVSEFSKTNRGKSIYQKGQSISPSFNVKNFAKMN